ncbi:hypothetical protein QQF64_018232 [Cirrhinus molitorella]|uniref:PPM-type phosphatase domain-containing protein n=1 Tax=Cirrhinus molitorella TaxID=172907 RepID=A0ABR3LP63_9TELE
MACQLEWFCSCCSSSCDLQPVSAEALWEPFTSQSQVFSQLTPCGITALLVFPRSRSAEQTSEVFSEVLALPVMTAEETQKCSAFVVCCCDGLWDECENMQILNRLQDTLTTASGNSFSSCVCVCDAVGLVPVLMMTSVNGSAVVML